MTPEWAPGEIWHGRPWLGRLATCNCDKFDLENPLCDAHERQYLQMIADQVDHEELADSELEDSD